MKLIRVAAIRAKNRMELDSETDSELSEEDLIRESQQLAMHHRLQMIIQSTTFVQERLDDICDGLNTDSEDEENFDEDSHQSTFPDTEE